MKSNNNLLQAAVVVCFMFVSLAPDCMCLDEEEQRLLVKMTLVQNASAVGACNNYSISTFIYFLF